MDEQRTIVCRCEEVTLEDLVATATKFQCSSRELKLRTRAGMGFCGGRTCRPIIDAIVANMMNACLSHEIPLGYQPPVRPVTFAMLGETKSQEPHG
jgi:NAD(P)H-nitrite reductase large subunit